MQSAGAKRDAADDLLEAERPEETALRPGNENVHILVEAERIAADRKEDGSPEAQDEKVAAALEAPQLSEQAARAPGPPPPPLAGRLRLLPGRTPTAPCPATDGTSWPASARAPAPRSCAARPQRARPAQRAAPPGCRAALAGEPLRVGRQTPVLDLSHHQGTLVPHPLSTRPRPATRLRHRPGRAGALGGDSGTKQGDSVALSVMPAQPATEPCSQPEV